jgi:PAS domain S-box-containing protein
MHSDHDPFAFTELDGARIAASLRGIGAYLWSLDPSTGEADVYLPAVRGAAADAGRSCFAHHRRSLRDFLGVFDAEDRHRFEVALDEAAAGDGALDLEVRVRFPGPLPRWVRFSGRRESGAGARATRFHGIVQDVHDRKLVELELEAERTRTRRAIEGSNDAFWDFDLVNGRFWASPRMIELLGYTPEDFAGNPRLLFDVTHPDDKEWSSRVIMDHVERGTPFDIEMRQRSKAGDYLWFHVKGQRTLDARGRATNVSGIQVDITEKKRQAEALEAAVAAAQAASEAKSAFLASMSHEIRTPMYGVTGMMELLQQTELTETQREYVVAARDSADALLVIIDDLLDFSKIEAGRLELEREDFEPEAVARDVLRLVGAKARGRDVRFEFTRDDAVPARVRGDEVRFRQILLNLVGNAEKFTERGHVRVTLAPAPAADAGCVGLAVAVEDTGIGIEAEALGRLHEPFVQADVSTTRRFGGTGLGLAIVQRLLRLMGGALEIDSEPGRGSTFRFVVVFERAPEPAAEPVRAAAPPPGGDDRVLAEHRVLFVDDNPVNRLVGERMLRRLGADVETAVDGQGAIEAWVRGPWDLVLMDCHMPVVDGHEATRTIRGLEPAGARTPILALTADARPGLEDACRASGMDGVLTKPIALGVLRDAVLLQIRTPKEP